MGLLIYDLSGCGESSAIRFAAGLPDSSGLSPAGSVEEPAISRSVRIGRLSRYGTRSSLDFAIMDEKLENGHLLLQFPLRPVLEIFEGSLHLNLWVFLPPSSRASVMIPISIIFHSDSQISAKENNSNRK